VYIAAGVDAHGFEHKDEIFSGHGAAGAGGVRTPPDAGKAGVEAGDADSQGRDDIGESEAAGIMEMGTVQLVARDTQSQGQ
jgi:hypothetical protein